MGWWSERNRKALMRKYKADINRKRKLLLREVAAVSEFAGRAESADTHG